MSSWVWEINVLGPLCVQQEGQQVTRFQTRKTAALLGLLAARPARPHRREAVIALLWPEAEQEGGRNRLRHALVDLRHRLDGADEKHRVIVADRLHVQLQTGTFTTDMARFETLLERARKAPDDAQHVACLTEAVSLYRGGLLEGQDEDWVLGERQRLADAYLLALRRLIKALSTAHEYEGALHYARCAVETDPLREEGYRSLMHLYAAMGRPGEALRQYREMERRLRADLNTAPSALSQQLRSQLLLPTTIPLPARTPPDPPATPGAVSVPLPTPEPARAWAPAAGPAYPTPLRGREQDVEQVCEMLLTPDTRLVSVTGLGGCGKTRVAAQVAQALRAAFAGRVGFVPLAAVQDCALLWDAVGAALQLAAPETPPDRAQQVRHRLGEAPTLLVLDNLEHLGEGGCLWLADLLEQVPTLTCLATSRQRLNLSREYEYGLQPLPVPEAGTGFAALLGCSSVQIFLDRARRVRPSFALTAANAPSVAAVCRTLEGLPLALELAASWVQTLTPAQIQAQLAKRFAFLVSRTRDAPVRHRSLQTVLDDSFGRLAPELQLFGAGLSVFHGGWTLEAAQAVCAEENALEYLTQLEEGALVRALEADEQMRYQWLETVREYAHERLSNAEREGLRQRHAAYYADWAQTRRPRLVGREASATLVALDAEQANLRAALAWGMAHPPHGARLALCLTGYWHVRGHFQEASGWLAQALQSPACLPPDLLRHVTGSAGNFAYLQADYAAARIHFADCLARAQQAGDPHDTAHALDSLGTVTLELGNLDEAQRLLDASLSRWRELSSPRYLALALSHRAILAVEQGDLPHACALYEESLGLYRQAQQPVNVALTLCHLAEARLKSHDLAGAAPLLEESLALSRDIGSPRNLALALGQMAHLRARQGQFDHAAALLREAVQARDMAGLCLSPKTLAGWNALAAQIAQALGPGAAPDLARTP